MEYLSIRHFSNKVLIGCYLLHLKIIIIFLHIHPTNIYSLSCKNLGVSSNFLILNFFSSSKSALSMSNISSSLLSMISVTYSSCLCGNNYCNLYSLECDKCGGCNICSSKCICEVHVFCIKQKNETILFT